MTSAQPDSAEAVDTFHNILGEVLWHSITLDPGIIETSTHHFNELRRILKQFRPDGGPLRVLEVASYAHISGYMLAHQFAANVVLSDISVDTLALGQQVAQEQGIDSPAVSRVASDFHDLPWKTGHFDLVYIASAVHHTWRWQQVLNELIRVTAPGGLLVIDNEPCAREFCFYRFRANRQDQYRALEKVLGQEGILRTVAEPYLGSRQEELFGMVENQSIPIGEFLDLIKDNGELCELTLSPEICMGAFEKSLIARKDSGAEAVATFIRNKLTSSIRKAREVLHDHDRTLGYSLPGTDEIEHMSIKTAASISGLDPDTGSESYRIGLSRLFGASIKLVMKKKATGPGENFGGRLRYNWGERNGVIIGYPAKLNGMLNDCIDLLPDIQRSGKEALAVSFPESDWLIYDNEAKVRTLTPQGKNPRMRCAGNPDAETYIVLIRLYAVYDEIPYRLHLSIKGNASPLVNLEIYQTDSYLMKAEFSGKEIIEELDLIFSSEYLDASVDTTTRPVFNVSAVRLCGIGQR